MRNRFFALALAAVLLLGACAAPERTMEPSGESEQPESAAESTAEAAVQKNFTLMVYMIGSDLEASAAAASNDLAGNDVFSKVHAYWRESYSADVTEAEALMNAVPSSVKKDIDSKYSYPSALSGRFDTDALVIGPASMGEPIQGMMDGFETALTGEKFKVQNVDKSEMPVITEWLNLQAVSGDLDSIGVLMVVLPSGTDAELEEFYSAVQYFTENGTAVFIMSTEQPPATGQWVLWFDISNFVSSTEEFAVNVTGNFAGLAQELTDLLLENAQSNSCRNRVSIS